MFITFFVALVSQCMYMPKLITMYALNMYNFLYTKYISILLKKMQKKNENRNKEREILTSP